MILRHYRILLPVLLHHTLQYTLLLHQLLTLLLVHCQLHLQTLIPHLDNFHLRVAPLLLQLLQVVRHLKTQLLDLLAGGL